MLVLFDEIFEGVGSATPALLLRMRLARARAAHRRALDGDFELTPEYLEWLNYIYARARYGLDRPWTLPREDVLEYFKWLVAAED